MNFALQPHRDRSRVYAQYLLETDLDVERVALVMAGEQSSGTFTKLPHETEELTRRHGAVVERIEMLEGAASASLPVHGAIRGPVKRAIVEISWNLENFGVSLPNLLATLAGNLFELREITGLRLLDFYVPESFARHYPGPQFGVAGTRALAGVADGPVIGTIIKPSVGLSAVQTAEIVQSLCEGGIDFIKDDELQANGPHCPFEDRVGEVMRVINAHADRTGKKVMYAFNITGDLDDMLLQHDMVVKHGGTCIMVSLNSTGLVGVEHLRKHSSLPIHGHRNGWGYLTRCPQLGFEYTAWHKFWRLAGVDHMHVNGLRNKFSEENDTVIKNAKACLSPMFDAPSPGFQCMPVFSSGQWAEQAFETWDRLRAKDLIYAAGGGIAAHPNGIGAGIKSIRHAWQAAEEGLTLEQAAANCADLRTAVQFFGK